MWIKVTIIILLLAVISSLFAGFYFLIHDESKTGRLVKSLTLRVSLTVMIIFLLIYGYYTGEIAPSSPWLHVF
ncbi:twin transmembrane helix small protein [Spartinivicinus poritis]|uniref:Twin transmembrane helix small protein n=1 Tax=Spartinivicinus poritis TaxID=2994640 RepID=A0ABT5UCW3_9GAMM|nr:twin transmembrane helix small protein [Spartinivicinus sp. A2-2]MDE1464211.1 twin transmembrane helix small protein [Spartinivicinus sp. A2-2]